MASIRLTAFEVVNRLKATRSHVDIYTVLREAGGFFGYEAFMITGLPRNPHQSLDDCKLISGWPAEWEHRYRTNRFVQIDPCIAHVRCTTDPFTWAEAVERARTPRGMVVMDEARAFGLDEGLCAPFHQIDGSEAGVSFGGRRLHLSDDGRAALHFVAMYAMSQAKAIARRRAPGRPASDEAAPLTAREIECVQWASAGKSAWEISVILTISRRTVESHLASAALKLQSVSQAQCVAEALRRGVID